MNKSKKSFTSILYNFIKGGMGEDDGTMSESDSAMTPDSGAGDEIDLGQIYDDARAAIDSGELELTEEAIRSWCQSKGLDDEQCQELVDVIMSDVDDSMGDDEPDGDDYSEEEMAKSTIKYLKGMNSGMENFRKSVFGIKQDNTQLFKAVGKLIDQNESLRKEVKFLKSQIEKVGNEPAGIKKPVTDISGLPSKMGRNEVIIEIQKGINGKQLTVDDMHLFESRNKLSERAKKFLENQGV